MADVQTQLSVNTDVFEKIAEIAAKEVQGVADLSKRSVDIKGIVKSKTPLKSVKVENINGAIDVTVYICADETANVKEVSENVQQNIKDKIQTMTGTAITRINVIVTDIKFENDTVVEEAEDAE